MHSYYLSNVFNRGERLEKIDLAVAVMGKTKFKDCAVVASGLSGSLMAVAIADKLSRPMAIVRKEIENNHGMPVEASETIKKYLIVDDQIDTGKTIGFIIETMKKYHLKSKCVGIILHDSCRSEPFGSIPVFSI